MTIDTIRGMARSLLDPVSLFLLLALYGFYLFYWPRFLVFVAVILVMFGLWAVTQKLWQIAIPIQTFFVGTWAYNFFEGRNHALAMLMILFLLLLGYGFWTLLGRPQLKSLTLLHSLYLVLATLLVWELAVIIQLFWAVEPWSRMFLVVAALIFLEIALALWVFKLSLYASEHFAAYGYFFLSVALAMILYFLMSYAISALAFWTAESAGPRFCFELFVEFAAGAFFPLDVLPQTLQKIFKLLPFASLVHFPLNIFLERTSPEMLTQGLMVQMAWILFFAFLTRWVWLKGIRSYSAYGG